MKILIYSRVFSPSVGGVQKYAMLLARGLARAGHDVTVATATPGPAATPELPFRLVREPSARRLWQLVGEAEVVQFAGPSTLPLALTLLRRRPVVMEHHGYQTVCPNGLLLYEPTKTACPGHFMMRNYGCCLRCNTATVGPLRSLRMLLTTFPRRWLASRVTINAPITAHVLTRLELPRSRVIYYGIPPQDQAAATADGELVRFAYVGRLVSEKGLPLLLDAAHRLVTEGHDFRVSFVGDGPERPMLERRAQELGIADRVEFTGFVEGDAFHAALADVAAVVMPSIWEETAGLAAMEQMMRARLVIAADIGGLGEVVDATGLKFPAGDAVALAERMAQVIREPAIVGRVGAAARTRAMHVFNEDRMVRDHVDAYVELAATS